MENEIITTYFCVRCKKTLTTEERKRIKIGNITRNCCADCLPRMREIRQEWDVKSFSIPSDTDIISIYRNE